MVLRVRFLFFFLFWFILGIRALGCGRVPDSEAWCRECVVRTALSLGLVSVMLFVPLKCVEEQFTLRRSRQEGGLISPPKLRPP